MGLRLLSIFILFFLLYYLIRKIILYFDKKFGVDNSKEIFKISFFTFIFIFLMFVSLFNPIVFVYFLGLLFTYLLSKKVKNQNLSQFIEKMSLLSWFGFIFSIFVLVVDKLKIRFFQEIKIKYKTKRIKKVRV